MKRLRGVIVALTVLVAVIALAGPSVASAHAGGTHAAKKSIPNSCFYSSVASKTQSYYNGSSTFVGYYSSWVQRSSCQNNVFRTGGNFDATKGQNAGCHGATASITGYLNGIYESYLSGAASTGSFGNDNCGTNYLEWDSSGYAESHGTTIESCNTVTFSGGTNPALCVSYYYS